jgi:hypothetical protein
MVTDAKIVVQVKLVPDEAQALALERTLRTVNECANRVSAASFKAYRLKGSVKDLRSMAYGELKARGLGAQAAQHVIKRMVDAYTTLRANIRAGNLGPEGSRRRHKAESKAIVFRADAAHTYDDRCLSWNYDAQTVSIWTMDGRLKNVRFACSAKALKRLTEYRQGESDLMFSGGKCFLAVPPARRVHRLQGLPRRRAVHRSGPGLHLPALPALRPHRARQPSHSGPFFLSSVRPRWAGRPRRRGQRARPRTLGVGIRQHARSGPRLSGTGGCDP